MKKRLCCLVLVLLLFAGAAAAPSCIAAEEISVDVGSAIGAKGETVSVDVTVSGKVASGNFNICFDSKALTLTGAKLAAGLTGSVNDKYASGKVRVSFVRLDGTSEYAVCSLSFRITGDTPAKGATVAPEAMRLYNLEGERLEGTAAAGTITRSAVLLRMESAEATEKQAVRTELSLGGTVSPTGGNFTVSYDPKKLAPTGVLGLAGLSDRLFTWKTVTPGQVRISFAGTEAVSAGRLCAIVFKAIGTAGEESELKLGEAAMYDEDGSPLDVELENGCVSIRLPGDDSAKLWVVGGAIEESGEATVRILLQGQGRVCGGQFAITFPESMAYEVLGSAECVINTDISGKLLASFGSESVYTEETPLITLRFTDAVPGGRIGFADESVTLYDEESRTINVVDLRPCVLSEIARVTATIEEEDIVIQAPEEPKAGEETIVAVTADLADMKYFTENAVEKVTVMLALYQNGRLIRCVSGEAEVSAQGITSVTVSAGSAESISAFSVLFVDGDSYCPLCACRVIGLEP